VPGMGSTFWFKVPFARVLGRKHASALGPYEKVLSGVRALVCDTIIERPKSTIYLRAAGANVIEARDISDVPRLLESQSRGGRAIDVAVIRVRIGDERTLSIVEALDRSDSLKDTKFVILVPHMSSSMAKMPIRAKLSRVVPSPLRRAKFYDAVMWAAGRASQEATEENKSGESYDFTPPTVERAATVGALILVAEDNMTNQFVVQSQLHKLGFAAEFVNDGREAWELLQTQSDRYGLLITDCHMPFIDGYKLTGLVRDGELTSLRHLPIVALTANALEGEADICRAAGMDDYLPKPTSLETLDATICKWLPRAASLRRMSNAADKPQELEAAAVKANPPVFEGSAMTAQKPINMNSLSKFLEDFDRKHMKRAFEIFLATESATPATLQRLIQSADSKGVVEAAHRAKGTAAVIYADALRDMCADIERLARGQDWDSVNSLFPRLEAEFRRVQEFAESFDRIET